MEEKDIYEAILEDIADRCGNDFDKMTLTDKLNYKGIMCTIRKQIYDCLEQYGHVLDFWYYYDVEKEIKAEQEPDFSKIHSLLKIDEEKLKGLVVPRIEPIKFQNIINR